MQSRPPTPEDVVDRIPSEALFSTDQEVLAQWCLAQLGWPPASEARVHLGELHHHLHGTTRLDIHVPLLTDSDVFQAVEDRDTRVFGFNSCGPYRVAENSLTIHGSPAEAPEQFAQSIQKALRATLDIANRRAVIARDSIEERRSVASTNVRKLVTRRVMIEQVIAQAKSNLGIPIEGDPRPSPIPVRPVSLDVDAAMQRAVAGVPELALDSAVRNQVLNTIESFAGALERLPVTARRLADLDEEALRDVLLFIVNANWRTAVGEAFSGAGKTDILMTFDGRAAFIAELKIYSGPGAVRLAVDQLCSYLVWRDTHAALVIFIKERKDVEKANCRIEEAIMNHDRYLSRRSERPARFVLATEDTSRTVIVDLITVPI